jgi:hypothetical protein
MTQTRKPDERVTKPTANQQNEQTKQSTAEQRLGSALGDRTFVAKKESRPDEASEPSEPSEPSKPNEEKIRH